MKYKKFTLKNGLRVIVVPMPSLESATVTVWVKTGSRNESDNIAGISHFLEHMVFKGSKKRPSAKQISEAVDSFGGEFNAATSKEWTNFYIKARTDALPIAFDVLSDMVLNPLLKSVDIEREKGVIIEEMAMYEDTPIFQIGEVFERKAFSGNSLGRDTIGFKKSVRAVKKKDFESYRNKHYFGQNIVVSVAGGTNEKGVIALVKKHFGNLGSKGEQVKLTDKFSFSQNRPQVLVINKPNEQAHLILGFVGYQRDHKRKYIEIVTRSVLGGGMSSRMFTEVREKRGLAYSVRVYSEHYLDTGLFATYAGVAPQKAQEAIKVMIEQYNGLATKLLKIRSGEFKKAKEYIKGHLALSLEDTKNVAAFFGERELFGLDLVTPEEMFKKIDQVKIPEIYNFAKETFTSQRLNLAIIGPFKNKKPFEKLLN